MTIHTLITNTYYTDLTQISISIRIEHEYLNYRIYWCNHFSDPNWYIYHWNWSSLIFISTNMCPCLAPVSITKEFIDISDVAAFIVAIDVIDLEYQYCISIDKYQ